MDSSAPPGLAARRAALTALHAVLHRRSTLEQALGQPALARTLAALSRRDRAFARLLITTVLRRKGQIDEALNRFLTRPLPANAATARLALALGAAELLFLEVPAHAAVSCAVTLGARDRHGAFKGVINAVLRRLARERASVRATQDAVALNLPRWLWQSWCTTYGEATARAIAEASLREPPLDLTPKDPARAAHLAETLQARLLPTGTLRCSLGGAIDTRPGFKTGEWWVQDAAAALPARLLGDVKQRPVLDLCAAPGGKTAQLAAQGACVTAIDSDPKRSRMIEENLARLALTAEIVTADARHWRPPRPVDRVLLDAPCTATGTVRRHPDALHLKTPAALDSLVPLQAALLAAAADMVTPGGVLIYCTCSLQREENEDQIARFLDRRPDFERWPITAAEIGRAQSGEEERLLTTLVTTWGDLRTLPSHWPELGGLDGFYAARLRRTG